MWYHKRPEAIGLLTFHLAEPSSPRDDFNYRSSSLYLHPFDPEFFFFSDFSIVEFARDTTARRLLHVYVIRSRFETNIRLKSGKTGVGGRHEAENRGEDGMETLRPRKIQSDH